MRAVKTSFEGGVYETSRATERRLRRAERKARKANQRRQSIIDEGTPSNPRFLMGAPTRIQGEVPDKPEPDKKKKKPKVKNPKGRGRTTAGTRRVLQRAVDLSCRNRSC